MTWGAVGGAAISVIGGSLLGGGSKGAERAAKDSAARAQFAQDEARRRSMEMLDPYADLGRNSADKLAGLLGVADPEGYAKRPELKDFENQLRADHFNRTGKDYQRNSNVAGELVYAKSLYDKAMKEWEEGKQKFEAANPGSKGNGDLLKAFTNEDFVKDPGYEFRQQEGNKALERSAAARGGLYSGAALKALDRYNQDYASNEFTNAFNRDAANKARTFSFLSGASGQGLQAAGVGTGANQNAANQNSQIQQNLGNNLSNMYQANADNQSNLFQSAIANGIYAYGRNKPVTGKQDGGYGNTTNATGQQSWYI